MQSTYILIALHGIFSCNLSQFPYNCLIPKILEDFRFDKDEGKHNGFLLHHFHQNALLALEKMQRVEVQVKSDGPP